ncbi:unknown seed protein USP [Lathyrus oleraceus]|uniref:BURP domain-containing protein n=1 Tax=Pisum sativum TaxID=3888 RepID=A0A9D5AQP2_PEA|nr:unknown seed protein USP-like [Pisum sativum]KAI5420922.1 hypothetical protein KIW84_044677 [Pisum sativum]
MEFKKLYVLALFLCVLLKTNGSKSGEEYWKSVWPNTHIPKAISDLLLSDRGTNMPMKSQEQNKYRTIFFEHDLYPGNTMNLGIQKHSDIQPLKSSTHVPIKKESQTFRTRKWLGQTPEKENQPFESTIRSDNATEIETDRTTLPFGICVWYKKEIDRTNHPFEFNVCDKKETEKQNQPFGISVWWYKTSDEKEAHIIDNYCGSPSSMGEDKHCVSSLESMMDFAISKLGKNIKVMSSSFAQNQDKYVVEEVKKIGDKAVMCHKLNFKNDVFYCHVINATTTYMVPLVASDGTKAKALTICHRDMRGMNSDVLYDILNVNPGTVSACHFIGNKVIAWVPDVSETDDHPCVI